MGNAQTTRHEKRGTKNETRISYALSKNVNVEVQRRNRFELDRVIVVVTEKGPKKFHFDCPEQCWAFPRDVEVIILESLPIFDVLNLSLVSKYFYWLIYHISLNTKLPGTLKIQGVDTWRAEIFYGYKLNEYFRSFTNPKKIRRDNCNFSFQVCICGDKSTGKTSFLKRLNRNTFDPKYSPSLQNEVSLKKYTIQNENTSWDIWCLPGTEQYRI